MSTAETICDSCGNSAQYYFAASGKEQSLRCWRHALFYQPIFRRALRVAIVVGTILFLINQADVVLTGHLTALVAAKIGLTYLVPFAVSTYSALQINRLSTLERRPD